MLLSCALSSDVYNRERGEVELACINVDYRT